MSKRQFANKKHHKSSKGKSSKARIKKSTSGYKKSKNKAKTENARKPQKKYRVLPTFEVDWSIIKYGIYKFDTLEGMARAKVSNLFNMETCYLVNGKGYVYILLDGNEVGVEDFGAVRVFGDEEAMLNVLTQRSTNIFNFKSKEYLQEFIRLSQREFLVLEITNGGFYLDISDVEYLNQNYMKNLLNECFAYEVCDIEYAGMLKNVIDSAV